MKRRDFLKVAGFTVLLGKTVRAFPELFKPVLIFNEKLCIGCRACMAACQLENGAEPETNLFWIGERETGKYPDTKIKFHQERICRECLEHPCLEACPFGAISVRRGGVVHIDIERCTGCERCEDACPYGAISFEDGKAKKCEMCFERISRGDIPRCVSVCPSGALVFGNLLKPEGKLRELLNSNGKLEKELSRYLQASVNVKPRKPLTFQETKKPEGERTVNTVCLACNARCGLRVSVKGDRIVQVDGNPYHPYNRAMEGIPYETPVSESFRYPSTTCAKPQMDNDYLHNPYRIRMPLKRVGPRGSGKFRAISWEQLIREVCDGGYLFREIGDSSYYPGIRDVLSDEPIDPEAPELGSRRNQIVWFTGRSQGGRSHFIKRWLYGSVGSVNYISHTDICGIGFRMGNYALTDGREVELKADFLNCKYMLVFGANLYSALQPGVNTSGSIISRRVASGDLKVVIADPRAPKAVSHAHRWLPVKPTKDGSLALGMLRVMLENGWYDKDFLSIPSLKEAGKEGRRTFSNASHLVIVDERHPESGRFLRNKDLKLKGNPDEPIVIDRKTGKAVPSSKARRALIEWEGELNGIKVKTAFLLMKESVFEHSLEFYSSDCGIPAGEIRETAREFYENAPYAAAFAYHGGGNYVGGTYASYAIAMLNAIVGNVNRKGGYIGKGKGAAKWQTGIYDLKQFPGRRKPKGIKISREKAVYEKTKEFRERGYPSKLPWFSFTKGGLSVSAISGIDRRYPYPIKVLITYFSNIIYSMPGGERFIETLKDRKRVPLHISIDTTVNETNIYADYIVPDITYLEGHYGFLTPHAPGCHFTAVRTPVFKPLTGKTGDGRSFCMENFIIDVSRYLGLPGFGEKAIRGKDGKLYPLLKPEDYYLRGISNLARNANVKDAPAEEVRYVERNYPVSRHRGILSEGEWRKVCTVISRGGVFTESSPFDEEGNFLFGFDRVCIWNERLGTSRNSLTGEKFWGTVKHCISTDYSGKPIEKLDETYPFTLITYKSALHTQSRTICYRQALVYEPDFELKVNPVDAEKLRLKDGDRVRIVSRSNGKGFTVTVRITELVRPGTLAYSHHFGHWQHGASKINVIKGEEVFLGGERVVRGNELIPDRKRGSGICPNRLTRLDEKMFNLPLVDPLGGIPDFSSTRVRIEREA